MKTEYYFFVIPLIALHSLYSFSDENKSDHCVKYASEFVEVKSGIVTRCQLNKKENVFYCKDNRKNYSDTYYYRHWSDFIKERNNFGTMRYYKYDKNMGDKSYSYYYTYDKNHRLLKEKSSEIVLSWNKWDRRGRNIIGSYNLTNNCNNRRIEIEYDDTKRSISIISSGGNEISENGCKKLPLSLYYIMDSDGNTILTSSAFHSGLISLKSYKILKYKTTCY